MTMHWSGHRSDQVVPTKAPTRRWSGHWSDQVVPTTAPTIQWSQPLGGDCHCFAFTNHDCFFVTSKLMTYLGASTLRTSQTAWWVEVGWGVEPHIHTHTQRTIFLTCCRPGSLRPHSCVSLLTPHSLGRRRPQGPRRTHRHRGPHRRPQGLRP